MAFASTGECSGVADREPLTAMPVCLSSEICGGAPGLSFRPARGPMIRWLWPGASASSTYVSSRALPWHRRPAVSSALRATEAARRRRRRPWDPQGLAASAYRALRAAETGSCDPGAPVAARAATKIFRRSRRRLGAILVPIESGDEIDRLAVGAVGRPPPRKIAECHRPSKPVRLRDDVVLVFACALAMGSARRSPE